jgi:3-oxoadipate enol-lactonase
VAGSGTLLLFLHGIGGNRRNWDAQLAFFSRTYKAAAWDARGYGDSDDYEGPLEFSVFSEDIVRVLDFLKVEKAHLVGLSMGGRIARNFALHHPERVERLVLANTTPGFGSLTPQQAREFVAQRRDADPVERAKSLIGPRARPGVFEDLVASLRAVHRESYLKTVEASVAQDLAAPIENIRAPTLVVTGDEDRLYPPAIAQDMVRRIPGASLAVIQGAGHLSNLEQPERFNQVVLEFLSTRRRS